MPTGGQRVPPGTAPVCAGKPGCTLPGLKLSLVGSCREGAVAPIRLAGPGVGQRQLRGPGTLCVRTAPLAARMRAGILPPWRLVARALGREGLCPCSLPRSEA